MASDFDQAKDDESQPKVIYDPDRVRPEKMAGLVDVTSRPFRGGQGAIQRIHDADARAVLSGAVICLFLVVFGFEMYGCIGIHYCTNMQMVKDTIEPFAGACFTALGAAIAFYFADRSKS